MFYPVHSFYGIEAASVRVEADIYDCDVEGRVPPELNGALYRLGPDTQYPEMEDDVILNGDGMMSMFRFDDGHVDFRCRYVRTARMLAERSARRRLYGKYRNPYTDDPAAPTTQRDNTGNTYAFAHHGRLFALREDSRPYEIDPESLETQQIYDFGGDLVSRTVCAHPKVDPENGDWWSFGLFSERRNEGEMSLQVADKHGKLIRQESFQAPFAGLSHDFAVTREHVIFGIMPLTVDNERIQAGGDFYAWDPDRPSAWGIMPRNGTVADLRWFEAPNVMVGHTMNAYTDDARVYVDAPVAHGNSFPFFRDVYGHRTSVDAGNATIGRLAFDLDSDATGPTLTPFPGAVGELPRLDERFAMTGYRYGYIRSAGGIARVDWETMQQTEHPISPPSAPQEPMFVPRSPDAPEGDGFVLTLVNHNAINRAELLVLDAKRLDSEPLARIKLPFAQSTAFHGSFVPRASA